MAERGRNRAFVDLLLERQGLGDNRGKNKNSIAEDLYPNNLDQIKDIVNRQRASVLYYSVAAGFLYAWLIVPTKGERILLFEASRLILFVLRYRQVSFGVFERQQLRE